MDDGQGRRKCSQRIKVAMASGDPGASSHFEVGFVLPLKVTRSIFLRAVSYLVN